MNLAKIDKAFTGAPPEVQTSLETVENDYRYGNYDAALAELDKLRANSALTDAQKSVVSQLTEQVKQAQTAPPPGQETSPSNQ